MKSPNSVTSPGAVHEFADVFKDRHLHTSFDTLDLTLSGSDTFDQSPIATATASIEASKKPKIQFSFKLRTPERRKPRRSSNVNVLAQSLPPVLPPSTSFDSISIFGLDEKTETSPDSSSHVPDCSDELVHTASERFEVFRPPSPKVRNFAVRNKLSKSLSTLPNSASIAKELELSLAQDESFDEDPAKKHTSWFPIERSRSLDKKTVRFSSEKPQVHLFHFDLSCINDYFYSSGDIANMKSARFEEAALIRRGMDISSTVDDLDMSISRRQKICIDSILSMALNHPDENEFTSIRGIEHFVYPELQQEMIRKKKEVQNQVLAFMKSKRPDPQGWRLANHSRVHSQWARDVAVGKGNAYKVKVEDSCENVDRLYKPTIRYSRRGTRRASVCASMSSVGACSAAADVVRMEFLGGHCETDAASTIRPIPCCDELTDEYEA